MPHPTRPFPEADVFDPCPIQLVEHIEEVRSGLRHAAALQGNRDEPMSKAKQQHACSLAVNCLKWKRYHARAS